MKSFIRRLLLTVGAVLLIGGWGMTRYAHEQRQSESEGLDSYFMWFYNPPGKAGSSHVASKTIFGGGVVAIAAGAGMISFAMWRVLSRE